MEISLHIDPNDISLLNKITSTLDANNIPYTKLERGPLRESEGSDSNITAYLIAIGSFSIQILKYISPIIRDYMKSRNHRPIEIHKGDEVLKVSHPKDLDKAQKFLEKRSKPPQVG